MNERDRVLQVMQSEGMNAKQFCQEVGISQGTLSNIMGGRNKPSLDVMQAILRRFRAVNCDWLIMGVGTMYVADAREKGTLSLFDNENEVFLKELPTRLEAGTPNIAGAIGLGAAVDYLTGLDLNLIHEYELKLKKYLIFFILIIPPLYTFIITKPYNKAETQKESRLYFVFKVDITTTHPPLPSRSPCLWRRQPYRQPRRP